jgi:hypothetical protein
VVDHELEFGWLECGRQANAVMEDGRMLVVTRLADRTLAAIWEPGGDPRTMPDQRVICLQSSERQEVLEQAGGLLRERLAAKVHEVWQRWMHYQQRHASLLPRALVGDTYKEAILRWGRQMQTDYVDLPDAERESDRRIADEYLALVVGDIAMLRRHEERLDARLTAVRTALDVAGVPEVRPYTETERAGLGVAGCPVGTDAGVMIPLEDRVRLLAAERDHLRDQVKDQTHDVRREVADLHAMLDMAGCASVRPRSFSGTDGLSGEEIAALPLRKYDLTDRVMQVIAERDEYRTRLGEAHTRLLAVADERDAEREASTRMVKEGFHCADQMCTSRRMLDRLHDRLDRERVPALDVADRWRGMNVEERLEALFAGWESSNAQALAEFKQQVDRDVDKFLAGFATDKLNKDRMP